jgi:hypothetical protein
MSALNHTPNKIGSSAMSIDDFCRRQKISVATYYKLKKRGLGPVELRFANIIRITPEAEAAWRTARENPVGAEAEDITARDEAMRARAQRASKVAVNSSHHIANRRRAARAA